jgi:hypothetical protein
MPKKMLNTLFAAGGTVRMQDGGKLPPGIKRATERAQQSKSVAPIPGARQARQAIQGYIGMDPSFSVMDPEAQALESAYRGGETASVLGDLFASLTPFAAASAAAKAGQVPGIAELIAYHGSPHKFKKFDASKIGTGEGAQAYGHGLYFAESPDVAKTYQPRSPQYEQKLLKKYNAAEARRDYTTMEILEDAMMHRSPEEILQRFTNTSEGYTPAHAKAAKDFASWHAKNLPEVGGMYKVDIPDEKIAQMLDWDKPLSQQPKVVQEFADKILNDPRRKQAGFTGGKTNAFGEEMTGADFYNTLTPTWLFGGEKGGVEAARQAGIPGIKYLDQASRDAKQGTRNFVVFPGEEQNIKMLDINGEPQMAAGGAVHMQVGGSPLDQFYQPTNPFARKAAEQERIRQEIARRRAEEEARRQTALDTSLPGPSPQRPGLPSMTDLKGAFERRVMPVISEAKQTAMTGGILGDLLRAYGDASVPANQAMMSALGRPFEQERPPEAPPEMTVPTAFERRGDIYQQLFGQAVGDPANLLDPGILRGVEAGAKAVTPSIMRGLEAGTQAVKPFAKTAAEMVEEMAMKGVPGTDAMQLRMGILPESPKLPEAPKPLEGTELVEPAEAKPFTGRIKNDDELITVRGQTPATVERAETALNSGQRVYKLDEDGNRVQIMDAAELVDADPKSLRVVNISPEEFEAVNLAAKRNAEAQRSMFDQIESLHKNFAPEEGWTPLNIVKGEVKLDKRGKPIINRQTGLPMTEVEVAKIPYEFHIAPEGVPKEAWEDMLAARITDEVDQVLRRAQAGDQEAINILKEAAWYRAMRDRLRGEFGGIGDVFADVLGTTSAQTGVEQNFDNAVEILRRFARGEYDKELLAYDKRLRSNETVDGVTLTRMFRNNEFPLITKAGGQLFNANSPASMGALLDMFRAIKAGDSPKTPNFTGNLIGLTNEATIDVWAARMLRRMADLPRIPPPAEKGVAGLHKVGSTLYQPKVSGEFGFGQDVFRKAAQELNNAGLLKAYDPAIGDVGPDDLQAIAWFIEKELWTKNKWTSKAGEGGSLDYEMSFAGSPQSEKIKSLRKEVGKEFSPKQFPQRKVESEKEYAKRLEQERIAFEKDKTNKAEQLKNLRADVDRYRLGVSGERPNKPMSDYGQAELASEFDDVVRDDPGVITYNLTSTLGSFMGDTERALNAEFITKQNFNPLPLERRLVEQGKHYDQDAVFMSKVVPINAPNARPGVEIYFKQKLTPADMALVTEKLRNYGVDGFTYISDMRLENRPNLRVTTQAAQNKTFRPFAEDLRPEPGSSGITFQYIPEFDDQYDAANAAAIMQQRREIFMQIIEDMANSGNVSDARLTHFDTKVFFRGDYDDYLARATGDSYQAPRREQQSGSISEESNTRGKKQQKLQRAVSDRVREEASSQAVKKPGGKKPLAKAAGGRVHVSDNLDTMLLELMRNKRYA